MTWRTIWRHGWSTESAMVVSDEMRMNWLREGKSAVEEMFHWIDRVHEYERNDRAEAHKEEA